MIQALLALTALAHRVVRLRRQGHDDPARESADPARQHASLCSLR